MRRGSRVWWLYYGIQTAILGSAIGAFLGVRVLIKEVWGVDIANTPSLLLLTAFFMLKWRAQSVAKAACRKAGLWQEAPQYVRIERILWHAEPSNTPVPNPAPLDLGQHSRRSDWTKVRFLAVMGVGAVALIINGGAQRDWDQLTIGILSAPMFLGLATVGISSIRDEVKIDECGLHLKRGHVVPWSTIKSGKVSQGLAADGTLHFEEIFLKDAHGKPVWRTSIRDLPPKVRAYLFAWIQARTGLREPTLHEEMYAWLESISGTFANR